MKNVMKRGAVYYVRAMRDGRQIIKSLGTGDKIEAGKRARAILAAASAENWDAIMATGQQRAYLTVPELCKEYEEAASIQRALTSRPSATTVRRNIAAFHVVLRQAGADPAGSTAQLDAGLVRRYVRAACTSDQARAERASRTIRSTLRQARGIFARWTDYSALPLPDISPFLRAQSTGESAVIYQLPPQDLIDRTVQAGRALVETDPGLALAFVLAFDLGLRAAEAAALERSWFVARDGRVYLEIRKRANFRPKAGHERFLPVHADTMRLVYRLGDPAGETVLPGSPTARYNLVTRKLAGWMRGLGWDQGTWPKAAHELRKLAGARWYTRLGAQVAQAWLGHRSVATTCQFYAALERTVDALAPDMGEPLAPEMIAVKQGGL